MAGYCSFKIFFIWLWIKIESRSIKVQEKGPISSLLDWPSLVMKGFIIKCNYSLWGYFFMWDTADSSKQARQCHLACCNQSQCRIWFISPALNFLLQIIKTQTFSLLKFTLTVSNWRPFCKKGVYRFLADFHFLQDWANFWQTDLFWHGKHRCVFVLVNLLFVL